jgi:ATP/maltotriose-dependent transcriptional regulator MalT
MRGERERAHLLLERMHATAREHGIVGLSENPPWPVYARIATNSGDWSAASAAYRRNLEEVTKLGHVSVASTQAAELARALAHLDEIDEAAESARKALRIGSADDIATQTLAAAALALVTSKRGAHGDAVDLARSAVGFANRSDWLTLQSDAYLVLADVEARRGDLTGAHLAAEEALTRFQAKENIVGEARAMTVLAGLDAGDGT